MPSTSTSTLGLMARIRLAAVSATYFQLSASVELSHLARGVSFCAPCGSFLMSIATSVSSVRYRVVTHSHAW
jgi:hypothetical protein